MRRLNSKMKIFWFLALGCISLNGFSQLSNQGYATNYAGGTAEGGSFQTQINTGQFGGLPQSEDYGIYLGLAAFNLESGVISVESVVGENIISDEIEGTLLRIEQSGNYDTIDVVTNTGGGFSFNPVFVGDYLVNVDSDPEKYVATYFGDAFLWDEADVLSLQGDSAIQVSIFEVPGETPTATGIVSGTIEEDFGDEENAKTLARRRAKKRKCGLRRRRTGGRTGQDGDEYELIAYGETNDDGEFEYGFLPEGTYRFFVEYPGIPLDESTFVQFDIGESGVSDDTFVLAVFASEEGVTVELILGLTSDFFTDLKVFPNPADEFIKVSYAEMLSNAMEFEILNLEGKVFKRGEVENKEMKINIENYPTGVYLLKFIDGDRSTKNELVFRFIKR